jgi:hypothetical protein
MQALYAQLLKFPLFDDLRVHENAQFRSMETSIPNQYKLSINGSSLFTFACMMHDSDAWNELNVWRDLSFANMEVSTSLHKNQAKCDIHMTFALHRLFKRWIGPVRAVQRPRVN